MSELEEDLKLAGEGSTEAMVSLVAAMKVRPPAALRAWCVLHVAEPDVAAHLLVQQLKVTVDDPALRLVYLLALARLGRGGAHSIPGIERFATGSKMGLVGYAAVFALLSLDPEHSEARNRLLAPWMGGTDALTIDAAAIVAHLGLWPHLMHLSPSAIDQLSEQEPKWSPARLEFLASVAHTAPRRALEIVEPLRFKALEPAGAGPSVVSVVAAAHRGDPSSDTENVLSQACTRVLRRPRPHELQRLGAWMEAWMDTAPEPHVVRAVEVAYAFNGESRSAALSLLQALVRGLVRRPQRAGTKLFEDLQECVGADTTERILSVPDWPDPLDMIARAGPHSADWRPPKVQTWLSSPISDVATKLLRRHGRRR